MIVFDFDKTLTNKDTLFGFYKTASSNGPLLFGCKRAVLLLVAVLYKGRIVSNTSLKRVGVFLFLRGKTKDAISQAARSYCDHIQLNDLYETVYLQTAAKDRLIISASMIDYLNIVFPGEQVYGSTLRFRDDKVSGLLKNMYGKNKLEALRDAGISGLEAVYTDSNSDSPLIELAEHAYLVQDSHILKIK